jgi:hypothetical protein
LSHSISFDTVLQFAEALLSLLTLPAVIPLWSHTYTWQ